MVNSDGLRRRAFHDGLDLRFVVETLQIIILKESNQLAKSDKIVQNDDLLLPFTDHAIVLVDFLVQRNYVVRQFISNVTQ